MAVVRTPATTREFRRTFTENIVMLDPTPKRSIHYVLENLTYLAEYLHENPSNLVIQQGEKWYFPQLKRGLAEVNSGKYDSYKSIEIVTRAFKGERADVSFLAAVYSENGRFSLHFSQGKTDMAGIRVLLGQICSWYSYSIGYYWRMQNDHSPLSFGGNVVGFHAELSRLGA